MPAQTSPLAKGISEWAGRVLADYLKRFKRNPNDKPKQLHDAVDSVVTLQPWEVFLLDSPILQRLRLIRQLGVGHFLFPTCGYSRFEHSVGTVQTASDMFDAVLDADLLGGDPAASIYKPAATLARRDVVRLAALLHDIGHCVFSHVSEKFYGRNDEVAKVVRSLSDFYGTKVSPAEATSILIISSDPFRALLQAARPRREVYDEETIIRLVCACIAGSKKVLAPDCFMAEIINGPVDCDKLDYLARDARMAGISTSLDTRHLLSKLRVATVESEDRKPVYSLATVPSGTRALDELLVSRIFLYDKFYYHPKVMAAEEVIRKALEHLAAAYPHLAGPVGLLDFGDDELLAMNASTVRSKLGDPNDEEELKAACALLGRAKLRDLPKRAFAFARRFMPEAPVVLALLETDGKREALTRFESQYREFILHLEHPDIRGFYTEQLAALAAKLGSRSEVFLSAQSAHRAAGSIYLPVILPDGTVVDNPGFLFKASEWTEAYALNKQTSYVFAYDDRALVHLAAERLFHDMAELSFAPSCSAIAKVSDSELARRRKNLPKSWIAHRLPPDHLRTPDSQARIEKQTDRFASFHNAFLPTYGAGMVEAWIAQFPDADLRDSALALVEHVTYVEPSDLMRSFARVLTSVPGLKSATWVPLRSQGGVGKSADQINYDLKELDLHTVSVGSLTPRLIRDSGQIVFFDDSLNSGVQSSCLVSSWFGRTSRCVSPDDEDPIGPLGKKVQSALLQVPITFVYYSKHPVGEKRLVATCRSLGMKLRPIRSAIDSSHPKFRLEGLQCDSVASKKRLVGFLQRRGETLLKRKVEKEVKGWTPRRAKRFALGYQELGLTLVYRHSISASTPVAMWMMAAGDTDIWLPLFPRKRRELRDVITPVPPGGTENLPEYRGA